MITTMQCPDCGNRLEDLDRYTDEDSGEKLAILSADCPKCLITFEFNWHKFKMTKK